jgi:hypothetical protein
MGYCTETAPTVFSAHAGRRRAIAVLWEVEWVPNDLLTHLPPLGREHVNLTGDYVWATADQVTKNHDAFWPLSPVSSPPEFSICPLMLQKWAVRLFWPKGAQCQCVGDRGERHVRLPGERCADGGGLLRR